MMTPSAKNKFGKKSLLAAVALFLMLSPAQAMAQACENAGSAQSAIQTLLNNVTNDLNNFYKQEVNFLKDKSETSRKEITARLDEFDSHTTKGLAAWWRQHLHPAMKDMTKQLHAAKLIQTMQIGMMMDAQMVNETLAVVQKHQVAGKQDIQLNESTCVVDGLQSSQTKALGISGGLSQAWSNEHTLRGLNTVMDERRFEEEKNGLIRPAYAASADPDIAGAAALGEAASRRETWKEYVRYFCDPERGDQGCSSAGSIPGGNRAVTDILWGPKQSFPLDNAETRRTINASQRYILTPRVFNPIKFPLVNSITQKATTAATEEMFRRRAWAARLNAVNNTVGRMLAERVVTTDKTIVQEMLGAAGLIAASTAGSSYREIQEVLSRGRYQDPEFLAKMVEDPKQLLQEQSTINGMRMQQMNDIYHRLEEMVFMEASLFASDLDKNMPHMVPQGVPVSQ